MQHSSFFQAVILYFDPRAPHKINHFCYSAQVSEDIQVKLKKGKGCFHLEGPLLSLDIAVKLRARIVKCGIDYTC